MLSDQLSDLIYLLQNREALVTRGWTDRVFPLPGGSPHLRCQKPMIRYRSTEVSVIVSHALRGLGSVLIMGSLQARMRVGSFDCCHGFFVFVDLLLKDHLGVG